MQHNHTSDTIHLGNLAGPNDEIRPTATARRQFVGRLLDGPDSWAPCPPRLLLLSRVIRLAGRSVLHLRRLAAAGYLLPGAQYRLCFSRPASLGSFIDMKGDREPMGGAPGGGYSRPPRRRTFIKSVYARMYADGTRGWRMRQEKGWNPRSLPPPDGWSCS